MGLLSRSDATEMKLPRNLNGIITAVMEQVQTVSRNRVFSSLRDCGHVSLRVDTVTLPTDGQTDKVVCFTRTLPNKL